MVVCDVIADDGSDDEEDEPDAVAEFRNCELASVSEKWHDRMRRSERRKFSWSSFDKIVLEFSFSKSETRAKVVVAQLAEHWLLKLECRGSIPFINKLSMDKRGAA